MAGLRCHADCTDPPFWRPIFAVSVDLQSDFGRSGLRAFGGAIASDLSKNRVVARRAARTAT
jgi:hypothetical protein